MNPLRLAWAHLRVTALYEFQYRLNFFVQLVQSALALITGLVAIGLVFSHTTELSGWSRAELLAVMGVHVGLGGVVRSVVLPNMQAFMYGVQEGEFDFTLVKPADAQLMVSVRQVRVWQLVDVAIGAALVGWAVADLGGAGGIGEAFGFAGAVLCGAVILYCLWMMVTTTAFKWVRVEEITQLMTGIFEAGRWPVSVYPAWLRGTLTFVIPLAFAITVPAEALAGRLTGGWLALTLAITILVAIATRLVWLWGIRNYSSASA
jgi:ABC-2 type transport system permease protein